ncbi:hypothetical protein [Psychroserpens algicola]|uniref:DUF4238 domain-containing protein n=1 Tax=Psychroserpens algicola TaxID=1719034 RepID=A0ABT0HCU7_9FLAO|nr:hypothetical protein [Psychroserpens algicola]MCK8482195.1 hypothetical protein [Psychroserpens algicola]
MTRETINTIGFEIFRERLISPSKLGISSRQINYWIHNAIVPFVSIQETTSKTVIEPQPNSSKNSKQKWIRLNLAEAVWVSLVKELFKFKIPLATIKELAYKVWQEPREQKYADEVFKYHINNNPNNLQDSDLKSLANHLDDELLMEHHYRTIINPFTDMVKSTLYRNSIPYTMLYVPETNNYEFYYGDKSLIVDLSSVYIQKPMISLPIIPIVSKVLSINYNDKKNKDLHYLTNVERQIRDIVVFKRPKVVEIAFEDNQINPIVITEKHQSREQLAEYILYNKIKKGSKLLIDIRSSGNYKITLIKK